MTLEEFNTQLYQKMYDSQEKYRDWLLSQPPEEILNHCYEYTIREDILMSISTMEELLRYKSELQSKLDAAEQQRKDLRNLERSYARKHDPEQAEQCSAEVAGLTKEIKKLRKDIGLCDDIALRSAQTREELEWIIEQQEQSREAEPNVQRDEKAGRQR